MLPLRRAALLLLSFFAIAASSAAQAPVDARSGPVPQDVMTAFVDSLLTRQMEITGVPGAVVAVVQDGRVLAVRGYGWADRERRVRVDPERTLFRVASLTKPVTATAVMRLVEEGKLRMDTDVGRMAGLPPSPLGAVTVERLLTHTAGLGTRLAGSAARSADDVPQTMEGYARRLPPRVRPAGRTMAYTNDAYALLGRAVEVAAGEPYAEAMRRRVLLPLGMTRSRFDLPPEAMRDAAVGYDAGPEPRRAAVLHPLAVPAAGLAATGADMARFLAAHAGGGGGVLSPATLAEARRTRHRPHPAMPGVAAGWFESFENGERALLHVGGIRGFVSGMYVWPERRLGMFVATNGYDPDLVRNVAYAFVDRWLPGRMPGPAGRPDPAQARRWAGTYRLTSQARSGVERAGGLRGVGELRVADAGDGTLRVFGVRFVPVAPGVVRDPDGDETIGFLPGRGGGPDVAVTTDLWSAVQVWERIPWWARGGVHRTFHLLSLLVLAVALFLRPRWPAPRRLLATPAPPPPSAVRAERLMAAVAALHLAAALVALAAFRTMGGAGLLAGVPPLLRAALLIATLAAALSLALPLTAVLAWRRGWWMAASRARFTATTAIALAYAASLAYWRLLGFG